MAICRLVKRRNDLGENDKFIVFKCVDYLDNSQLLLSQLFNIVKGHYTGASEIRKDIFEVYDEGVLFWMKFIYYHYKCKKYFLLF